MLEWHQANRLKIHKVLPEICKVLCRSYVLFLMNVFTLLIVAEQLQAQHNAVKMLANRVRLILEYIRAMERGEVPKSHDVLREAKSLTHRLPVLNSEIFQEEYYTVSNCILIYLVLTSAICIVGYTWFYIVLNKSFLSLSL